LDGPGAMNRPRPPRQVGLRGPCASFSAVRGATSRGGRLQARKGGGASLWEGVGVRGNGGPGGGTKKKRVPVGRTGKGGAPGFPRQRGEESGLFRAFFTRPKSELKAATKKKKKKPQNWILFLFLKFSTAPKGAGENKIFSSLSLRSGGFFVVFEGGGKDFQGGGSWGPLGKKKKLNRISKRWVVLGGGLFRISGAWEKKRRKKARKLSLGPRGKGPGGPLSVWAPPTGAGCFLSRGLWGTGGTRPLSGKKKQLFGPGGGNHFPEGGGTFGGQGRGFPAHGQRRGPLGRRAETGGGKNPLRREGPAGGGRSRRPGPTPRHISGGDGLAGGGGGGKPCLGC